MAVVLPTVFYSVVRVRGVIRQYLIEQLNVVDAIIGLPSQYFLWHVYSDLYFGVEEKP